MRPHLRPARLAAALGCALVLAACGGGGEPEDGQTPGQIDVGAPSGAAGDPVAPAPESEPAATERVAATPAPPTDAGPGEPVGPLQPSEPFGLTQLTLSGPGGEDVDVPAYVAADPESRQRGLMFREDLPAGTGMVFLFPDDNVGGFWMANTLIPLSIAFYDASGEVVSVLDMAPCTEEDLNDCPSYDPGVPYRGALEVNQGFFDEIGLTEGWTVQVPDDVPAAR